MEEIEELRFPVWAVCSCPRRSRNEFTFGSIGEPIRIGLTNVAPGDIVVADGTGVVVVPADRASDVLELARSIASSEQRMEAQIQSGLNDIEWDQV